MSLSSWRNRILLKLSGEAIWWANSLHDHKRIDTLVEKILWLSTSWVDIAIVCGWGNIRRARDQIDSWIDRVKSDHIWMMAWVINAVVLNERINAKWWDCVIYSAHAVSVPTVTNPYNAIKARRDLWKKRIVLCAGWVWYPYFTHDSAAVLRWLELQCDVVVKCTKVDGVYSADPLKDPSAKKFDHLTLSEVLDLWLNVMDRSALALANDESMPLYVCHMDNIDLLKSWEAWGTLVTTA
jgi:uridylate kinase